MSPRVLMIDNYDSFTYNSVQALRILGATVDVRENDAIEPEETLAGRPTHLVISPGPGRPEDAGNTITLIDAFLDRIPILGICLGHQALVALLGGRVGIARTLVHGKASRVYHDRRGLFGGLPNPFEAGRYHSLAADEAGLPRDLSVTAYTSDGEIMGVRHRTLPVCGVQFHPESVLTPAGDRLFRNFLDFVPKPTSLREPSALGAHA